MKSITRFYKGWPLLLLLVLTFSSCGSHRSTLPYFSDLKGASGAMPVGVYELTVVPDDQLLISVTAPDQEAAMPYNNPYQPIAVTDFNQTRTLASAPLTRRNQNLTYQPYVVGADGFINFPRLGKIHVAGMTLAQVGAYIEEKVAEKVVDPMVTVELVNFHVAVMGEVAQPGARLINRERYSILDALADAGDMTPYGERSSVLLIREEDGRRVYHRLDLNSAGLLESPYFYLKQNDVVYVEPNKIRQANSKVDQDKQFKLSMTSVIVSAASVIASLVIALFIK
ncbi:MAG: polysaccharide biosynthesis/export family protein [Muribaculaceae bacterium]|nr:polysaccharide biosynthesis/export family protein [Muribaculaceae bacterium]MDE6315273.1 polysaccharide biosynthesis/export family protein [Muribaculaceae bacterium]